MIRVAFKLTARPAGSHIHVTVFCGRDEHHRAHVGKLVMLPHEWDAFRAVAEREGWTVEAL